MTTETRYRPWLCHHCGVLLDTVGVVRGAGRPTPPNTGSAAARRGRPAGALQSQGAHAARRNARTE